MAGCAAGRTGRAGSTGISVVLVDRKKESLIPFIERKAGLKFERIGAPQPQDVARIASNRAVEAIRVCILASVHCATSCTWLPLLCSCGCAALYLCEWPTLCGLFWLLSFFSRSYAVYRPTSVSQERRVHAVQGVDESVLSLFTAAAAQLLADMPAEQAIARALAHMTGQTTMQASNLLRLIILRRFGVALWGLHARSQALTPLKLSTRNVACLLT